MPAISPGTVTLKDPIWSGYVPLSEPLKDRAARQQWIEEKLILRYGNNAKLRVKYAPVEVEVGGTKLWQDCWDYE